MDETELIARYSRVQAVVPVSPIEGWELPVTEAMVCGRPFVMTAGNAQVEAARVALTRAVTRIYRDVLK